MQSLREQIAVLDEQLCYKEKHIEMEESIHDYKQCDKWMMEVGELKAQRWNVAVELKAFEAKEKQARWYLKRKQERRMQEKSKLPEWPLQLDTHQMRMMFPKLNFLSAGAQHHPSLLQSSWQFHKSLHSYQHSLSILICCLEDLRTFIYSCKEAVWSGRNGWGWL